MDDDDERQAMTTLQDPIQEDQQSVQIVQPPAAPSAHDIRQHMKALRRQMEELSANDIRVRREVREMQTQVSVMELKVRSLLSSLTSMTSQMTTMWNAVHILQDAVGTTIVVGCNLPSCCLVGMFSPGSPTKQVVLKLSKEG